MHHDCSHDEEDEENSEHAQYLCACTSGWCWCEQFGFPSFLCKYEFSSCLPLLYRNTKPPSCKCWCQFVIRYFLLLHWTWQSCVVLLAGWFDAHVAWCLVSRCSLKRGSAVCQGQGSGQTLSWQLEPPVTKISVLIFAVSSFLFKDFNKCFYLKYKIKELPVWCESPQKSDFVAQKEEMRIKAATCVAPHIPVPETCETFPQLNQVHEYNWI